MIKSTIIACMLFTFFLVVWGMTGDCPYRPEGDEMFCLGPALEMAQANSFNPRWFAHPASTSIYPLLFYVHFLNAVYFHGALFNGTTIENIVYDNMILLCYLPRFVNVFLFVGSVPVLYLIAKELFSRTAGLLAIWMFVISQSLVLYMQVIRSESPAIFFSLVALLICVKLYREPSLKKQLLAAAAIGLSIASRYPMAALLVPLMAVNIRRFVEQNDRGGKLRVLKESFLALAMVVIVFGITTPYFFLDFKTFMKDMYIEKIAHGLGCDGLSPLGNCWFYLSESVTRQFHFVQTVLACFGALLEILRRRFNSCLLILYGLAILAGSSLHVFHNDRYMLPIMPILALFAGHALATALLRVNDILSRSLGKYASQTICTILGVVFLVNIEWEPFIDVCAWNVSKIYTTTEPTFYNWVFQNMPKGTPIAFVGVWEGGHRERLKIKDVLWGPEYFDFNCGGKYESPFDVYRQGYKYFIWTEPDFRPYVDDPKHYPRESLFFKELFANTEVIKVVAPQQLNVGNVTTVQQRGPTYKLARFVPKTTPEKCEYIGPPNAALPLK